VTNFTAVWGALWQGDPTPVVLLKTLAHITQCSEDEKGSQDESGNKYPTNLSYRTFKVAWDLHDKVNTGEDGLHMVSKSIKTSFSRN